MGLQETSRRREASGQVLGQPPNTEAPVGARHISEIAASQLPRGIPDRPLTKVQSTIAVDTVRMSRDRAAEVMNAMINMFATGDLSEIDATVSSEYLDHQGLGGETIHGVDGFAAVVAAARTGYQVLEVIIEDLISEGDRAAARIRWRGVRNSGETVDRQTLDMVRIQHRKAIEHWGASF